MRTVIWMYITITVVTVFAVAVLAFVAESLGCSLLGRSVAWRRKPSTKVAYEHGATTTALVLDSWLKSISSYNLALT